MKGRKTLLAGLLERDATNVTEPQEHPPLLYPDWHPTCWGRL